MQQCATGPLEEWVYWHNNLADAAAESINFRRHEAFWTAWTGLDWNVHSVFTGSCTKQSCWFCCKRQGLQLQDKDRPWFSDPVCCNKRWWPRCRRSGLFPPTWWNDTGAAICSMFMTGGRFGVPCMMHGDSPLVYVSGIQLFISFNLHTGFTGPWCYKKRWYSQESDAPPQARLAWGSRCKQFLLLFRSYLKGNGMVLPQKMARANSAAMATWVICYKLKWPAPMVDHVDRVIFSQLGRQACSTSGLAAVRAAWTAWVRETMGRGVARQPDGSPIRSNKE